MLLLAWHVQRCMAKCNKCRMFSNKPQLVAHPLKLLAIEGLFKWWEIDFIVSINLTSSLSQLYIITAMDYFTKWVEAKLTKKDTFEVVCKFIKENILVRSRVPLKLFMDNAT